MKAKSARLKVVLDLAQRKENEALAVMVKKRAYLDEQQNQLNSLSQYLTQFIQDLKISMVGVSDVNRLQSNQVFMSQVEQAIQQQEYVLGIAQREYENSLNNWSVLHQKSKGMSDLIDRYRNVEQLQLDKRIEKQIEDDLTARRSR